MNNDCYLVAIDVGTTNSKTIVFDPNGNIAAAASLETRSIYNRLGPGWVEQDAELIWDAVVRTCRQAVAQLGANPRKIAAVGVTSFRQTVLPVDELGDPIRLTIPWCIRATHNQAAWVRENVGCERIYSITGVNTDPHWTAATFRYLIEEEPEVYEAAHKLVGVQDFVLRRLGVERFVQDHSHASTISLLDLRRLGWSSEICAALGLDPRKLPDLVEPGSVVGAVSPRVAKLTGLRTGTPLIAGGGDCQCSAVGCGVISEGQGNVVIGTSAVGIAYTDAPAFDPEHRIVCHAHSYPGKYIMQHTVLTGGGAYRWFRDVLCAAEAEEARARHTSPYEIINLHLQEVPVGSNGVLFLPHLVGAASPYWNDEARGVFIGLNQASAKGDLARSIIEGVALEVAKGFGLIEELGLSVEEIRLSGGACQQGSPWNQIQADVYGKPVLVTSSSDTTALGAAIMAGVAIGQYPDIPSAVGKMVHLVQRIEPRLARHDRYRELQQLHDLVYRALAQAGVWRLHSQTTLDLHDEVC
jgi:sugar (pentulose or hexulose) kinase